MRHLFKAQGWAYFLLAALVLLAWTLFRYGWAKLTQNMFGVTQKTLDTPLKQIDLTRLSWYLANHELFNRFIGFSQVSAAVLLTFNRTVLFGAFVSLPIWLNILMWDLTFVEGMTTAFTFRLSFYLILTLLLIYQRRKNVVPALWQITAKHSSGVDYPVWVYLTLPLTAIGIEVIGSLPHAILLYTRLLQR